MTKTQSTRRNTRSRWMCFISNGMGQPSIESDGMDATRNKEHGNHPSTLSNTLSKGIKMIGDKQRIAEPALQAPKGPV